MAFHRYSGCRPLTCRDNRQKAIATGGQSLQNATDLQRYSFLENSILLALSLPDAQTTLDDLCKH